MSSESSLLRPRSLASAILVFFSLLLVPPHAVLAGTPEGFDTWGDFATLAKEGFAQTVQGAFPNLVVNSDGGIQNSYSWSMAYYEGQLYVGTVRNLPCFFGSDNEACPDIVGGGEIPDFDEDFAAQIWRYTPGPEAAEGSTNANAINGTWELQHTSSLVSPLLALLSGGLLDGDEPIDIGYRNLEVCDTGEGDVLYSSNLGLYARIQYLADDDDWEPASGFGILDVIGDLIGGTQDLGMRALQCFKGRLWTSPAGNIGEFLDPDIPAPGRGIVLANSDPSGSGVWEEASLVNFGFPAAAEGGSANIIGIFTIGTWDVNDNGSLDDPEDLLVAGGVDRDFGTHIMVTRAEDCPPYPCTWQEIGSTGAARPVVEDVATLFGDTDFSEGVEDNAGVSDIEQLGSALYLGLSEAAGTDGGLAELIRYNAPPPPAQGENPGEGVCVDQICDYTWDLVVGFPRHKATIEAADPTFNCVVGIDLDYCEPISGLGLGASAIWPEAAPGFPVIQEPDPPFNWAGFPHLTGRASLSFGDAFYLGWRMETHTDPTEGGTDVLYITTFEQFPIGQLIGDPDAAIGWDLWKTTDGTDFARVFANSGGHPDSYGGRSIASTEHGLFIGSASFNREANVGGTQVILGTTAPAAGSYAPVVTAGTVFTDDDFGEIFSPGGLFLFDDDNFDPPDIYAAGNGSEDTDLSGLATGLFGATLTAYEWFEANVTGTEGTPCLDLTGGIVLNGDTGTPDYTATSDAGDPPLTTHYTLRVTDNFGNVACSALGIEVSANLPPYALITTEPPLTADGDEPDLFLVDWNNNGHEDFRAMGECFDLEASLASCAWQLYAGGVLTESPLTDLDQMMRVPRNDLAGAAGDSSPEIDLVATDNLGFDNTNGFEVTDNLGNFDAFVFDVTDGDGNDSPHCQNSSATVMAGSFRIIDPIGATLAGSSRICGDADDADGVLTFAITSGGPNFGTAELDIATGFPIYFHTETEGLSPYDFFHFEALDDEGDSSNDSSNVIVGLHIDTPDFTLEIVPPPAEGINPGTSIEFQVSGLNNGERARLYLSRQISPGDGACAPAGSPCLNLTGTIAQLQTNPASGGVASRVVSVPPGAQLGNYLMQAIVPRGGPGFGASIKSNIIQFELVAAP